jgi:uncharacterized membrane protein
MIPYRLEFDHPAYLVLLLLLIPIVWFGWKHLAVLGSLRQFLAIGLRSVVWTAIVLAIAGVQWVRTDDRMTVMYVLDQSESIPALKRQSMLEYVIRNVKKNRDSQRGDRAGIVVFGRDASIEIPPFDDNIPALRRLENDTLRGDATNLESALNLAQASMPEDTSRRIVIVTDGNENIGAAERLAARLAGSGVGIDVVPVRLKGGNEVLVEKIDLPSDIRKGQPFEARIVINNLADSGDEASSKPVTGRLRLKQKVGGDETLLLEETVTLDAGKNVIPLRHQIEQPAAYVYDAEFLPQSESDDSLKQNNSATAYTYVRGKGRVLVIVDSASPGDFDLMVKALRDNNIEADVQPNNQLFGSLAELQAYDAVILAGVPRSSGDSSANVVAMTDEQIEMLVRNTQQLGAGLLMIGGPESFGAGGWTGTKIEEAMPVDFKIKNDKVQAVGALALIMHASEMADGNKWQKVIAKAAVEQLGPSDYAGVLHWTMQGDVWMWGGSKGGMLSVGPNRKAMLAAINRMTPGDMPQFDPAMKMAVAGLTKTPAAVKHCIIISDGDPTPPSNATLRAFSNPSNPKDPLITISTVAVASHGFIENQRLQDIATATGGKFYAVKDGRALPKIFQREARRVSKPLVIDLPEGASPEVVYPHPMLEGLDRVFPPITGMVLTQTKDSSLPQVLMRSPKPDSPENSTVLAVWNYGLGRTAVVTTDGGQRWAKSWAASPQYEKFYAQLVRWLMRPTGDTGKFSIATQSRDGQVQVIVNALDQEDSFLNFLEMNSTVLGPDLDPIPLRMNQTAPGRYVGTFPADRSGNYFVNVVPAAGSVPLTTGVTVPYSDEYRVRQSNEGLIQQLASVVPQGGEPGVITPALEDIVDDSLVNENAFRGGLAPARSIRDAWHWFVLASCLGFLFDIFVRRVSLRFDWVSSIIKKIQGRPAEPSQATQRLDTLRKSKELVAEETQRRRASVRFETTADDSAASGNQTESNDVNTANEFDIKASPKPNSTAPITPQASEKSYTERLLEAKRKANKDR